MSNHLYLSSSALNRTFWLCFGVLVACTLWTALTPVQAAQSQFRMQASTIAVAAGKSRNSNFALDSCIDQLMAGSSSSSNFRLQTGCGAGHSTSYFEEGVPTLSSWSMMLLTLSVVLLSTLYLRSGNTRLL